MIINVWMSEDTKDSIDDEIERAVKRNCQEQGVEEALVRAVMKKESQNYPFAIKNDRKNLEKQSWFTDAVERFRLDKDDYRTWSSLGLMQTLYVVAYDLGFRGKPEQLFVPDIGVMYGCILLKKLDRGGRSIQEIISRYNQGGAYFNDLDGDGVKDPNEPYNNQPYVDQVYKYYKNFGGKR